MPGCMNLNIHLDTKDKNGVRDWATQSEPGIAMCNVCLPHPFVRFFKGKRELHKHSETLKHIKFSKQNTKKSQVSIIDMLKEKDVDKETILKQARDLEIALTFSYLVIVFLLLLVNVYPKL